MTNKSPEIAGERSNLNFSYRLGIRHGYAVGHRSNYDFLSIDCLHYDSNTRVLAFGEVRPPKVPRG